MSMYEPPTDNSNYIDQLEFQLKQADQRIAELKAQNATLEAENERYKTVLESIAGKNENTTGGGR